MARVLRRHAVNVIVDDGMIQSVQPSSGVARHMILVKGLRDGPLSRISEGHNIPGKEGGWWVSKAKDNFLFFEFLFSDRV